MWEKRRAKCPEEMEEGSNGRESSGRKKSNAAQTNAGGVRERARKWKVGREDDKAAKRAARGQIQE